MEDLDLPEIKRKKVQEKKAEDKKEFKDLFQSDSDSDDDDDGLRIKGKPTVEKLFNLRESPMTPCPLGGSVCHRQDLHGQKTNDKW